MHVCVCVCVYVHVCEQVRSIVRLRKLHRTVARMGQLALARAFSGFVSAVQSMVADREQVQWVCGRLLHLDLSKAFNRWQEYTEEVVCVCVYMYVCVCARARVSE